MPRLSQLFVKSSLLCMALGFTIGGLLLMSKTGILVSPIIWLWFPTHIVLLLNGWLIQLAMGVAYWILPRIIGSERGRLRWAYAAFVLMQMGLVLMIISLLQIWWPPAREIFALGVLLHGFSVASFCVHAWPRVRGASSHQPAA